MTKLTKENLEQSIKKIQSMVDESGGRINTTPTKLMYQPAALKELGLTHEDLLRILSGNIRDSDRAVLNDN